MTNYDAANGITCNTEVLKSSLCDYNDAYILVTGDFKQHNQHLKILHHLLSVLQKLMEQQQTMLKIQIQSCQCTISQIIFQVTLKQQEVYADFNADISNNFKSYKYKAKLLEKTEADGKNEILKNATITVPLKYFGNFWRSLEMPLINYKIELKLK